MNEAILVKLSAAYESWVRSQNLTLASAEELLAKPLTDHQRAWLEAFTVLWYATDDGPRQTPKEDQK